MKIPAELEKMTIAQLKKELEERGVSTKGCRLKLHYQERLVLARKGKENEAAPRAEPATPPFTPPKPVVSPWGVYGAITKPFSPVKSPAKPKATKKKKAGPEASASSGSKTSYLSVLVLILALVIGVAVYLTTEDTKISQEKINALYDKSRENLEELYLLIKGYVASLDVLQKLTREFEQYFGSSGGCKPDFTEAVLSSVVFQNTIWTAWSKAVVEAINHPADETAPKKGVAILLARNTSYGGSAFANVKEILADKCDCVAQFVGVNTDVKGVEISSKSRGQVQRELGDFLGRCSHGIVVVENIELFGPECLNPFHNAMSEQGGLTYDGKTIPSYNAKYILTMNVPMQETYQSDEEAVAREVKEDLTRILGGNEFAAAFRRRIDFTGLGRI